MANEKKNVDITEFYSRQELVKFIPVWQEASEKIEELIAIENPDGDTLSNLIKAIEPLKKAAKGMNHMALLLSKQKACEAFLEEKGLSEEFAEFVSNGRA